MSMFGLGGPKKTPKEQAKEVKKDIRASEREMDRELRTLEREEQKLIADIKKAAKDGNEKVMKILAGNLVQLRSQRDRTVGMKANLTATGYRTSIMASQAAVADTMGKVTKVMGDVNSKVDAAQTAKVMQEFARQNEYMNMKEDMIGDALQDAFDGDEEEEDAVVNQVLDEIGLQIGQQLVDAPSAKLPAKAEADAEDLAVEELLKSLPKVGEGV